MRMIAGALLCMLLSAAGCAGHAKSVPADFEVEYMWGAGFQDAGCTILYVKADGRARLLEIGDDGSREEKEFSLTGQELSGLYEVIKENKFYKLEKSYRDFEVLDGGYTYIEVKGGGREHKVVVTNTSVPEYGRIAAALYGILEAKGLR